MRRIGSVWAVGVVLGGLVLAACGSATEPKTSPAPSAAPGSTLAPPPTAPPTTTPPSTVAPATLGVHVWFLNQAHAATGEEPLFEPVDRQVKPPAVAAGALDALFAGPTAAEQADGLRLITSGASGYSRLHIQDGIAYVTLEGGCSSGGSTMTIASEIIPTLRQFSSVDHVKIFAPDGTTETPTGPTDSIPFCLEP